MKMELGVTAPRAGRVERVGAGVVVGAIVPAGHAARRARARRARAIPAQAGAMFWFMPEQVVRIVLRLELREPLVVRRRTRPPRTRCASSSGMKFTYTPPVANGAAASKSSRAQRDALLVLGRRRASACARSSRTATSRCGYAVASARHAVDRRRRGWPMKISHSAIGSWRDGVDQRRRSAPSSSSREVVRLPVVARARREQRIERLSASRRTASAPTMLADRLAERAQRRDRRLALRRIAARSRPRARGSPCRATRPAGTAAAAPCAARPSTVSSSGAFADELAVAVEQLLRLRERMDDQPGEHLGPDRVQPELERRDDAEVAAAAADRPEQVRVLASRSRARSSPSAVTTSAEIRLSMVRPNLRLSQPKPPPSVSPATPVVELMPSGVASPNACVSRSKSASSAPGSTRAVRAAGVDAHRLHRRQVDHQAAVAAPRCRRCCGRRRDREQQAVLAREVAPRASTSAAPARAHDQRRAGGRSSRSRSCAPCRSPGSPGRQSVPRSWRAQCIEIFGGERGLPAFIGLDQKRAHRRPPEGNAES